MATWIREESTPAERERRGDVEPTSQATAPQPATSTAVAIRDERPVEHVEDHAVPALPEPPPPAVPAQDVQPPLPAPWDGSPQLRPVVPQWMTDRDTRRAGVVWARRYASHASRYHTVRAPRYVIRWVWWVLRGLVLGVAAAARWTLDTDAVELAAARDAPSPDPATVARLRRAHDERIRTRGIVALVVAGILAGGVAALVTLTAVVWWWVAGLGAAVLLGWIGHPSGDPIIDRPVETVRHRPLTTDVILRALRSAKLTSPNPDKAREEVKFATAVHRDGRGWGVHIDLPYGKGISDAQAAKRALASGLDVRERQVWIGATDSERRIHLWVAEEDLLRARPPRWPLLGDGRVDVYKGVPWAQDARGRLVTLPLIYSNLLIGSLPGAGKTAALRLALLGCSLDPTAELRLWELKGTGDLEPLSCVAQTYGSGPDDETLAACLDDLRAVHRELEERGKAIRQLKAAECPDRKVTRQLSDRVELGLHPLVLAIDECQELFSHPEFGKEAARLVMPIIKRGRALGVILMLATQRPDKDSLPKGISDNVGTRFCLRVMGHIATDMILGTGANAAGMRASDISSDDLGVGWLVGVGPDPAMARTFYVDTPAAQRVAERARQLREDAGTLSGVAVGDDPREQTSRTRLLEDVLEVMGTEEQMHSRTICAALQELDGGMYSGWEQTQLASTLLPYGLRTGPVWAPVLGEDRKSNLQGLRRADVAEKLRELKGEDSDSRDSRPDDDS